MSVHERGWYTKDVGQRNALKLPAAPRGRMYLRYLITIILFALLNGCAGKLPSPEPDEDGIRFSFLAPAAKSVAIAGTFNHWDAEKDRLTGPDQDGIWIITLPLADGRYEYCFVINNKDWMPDPSAPSLDDELGRRNSLLIVAH